MLKSIEQLKILEERNLVNDEEIIRLRGGIQRNNISANLTIGLIIKLSDEIENSKEEIKKYKEEIKKINKKINDLETKNKSKEQ
jgi:hypothetical protein